MERQNPLSEKEQAFFESLGRMVKNSLHSVFRTLFGKEIEVHIKDETHSAYEETLERSQQSRIVLTGRFYDQSMHSVILCLDGSQAIKIADLMLTDTDRKDSMLRDTDLETLKVFADQVLNCLSLELGEFFEMPLSFLPAEASLVRAQEPLPPIQDFGPVAHRFKLDIAADLREALRVDVMFSDRDIQMLMSRSDSKGEKEISPTGDQPKSNISDASSAAERSVDFLMDVPVNVSVELGSKSMPIKDIFQFKEGSVIELDKLAGEAVDIKVNNTLIAKGEVVVIDEHFGFRVTEIVDARKRLESLRTFER
ncbi:flagellar motor switch protein FliN [PVC group bacterium]|nr:flagellar motor switch protein FliN [PVC group bacterium]